MKTSKKDRLADGSVLIVTLFIASLFGVFLYSYLSIVQGQRAMVARSQAWNAALAMAESGAEEALAHLNPGISTASIPFGDATWGQTASGLYGPVERTLQEGSYSVVFTGGKFPTIYATGYVSVPSIPANLKRVVEVKTKNSPLFTSAMAARYNIDLNGNGIATDSFNSVDPALSTNGRYDPAKTNWNGDIASIQGIVNVSGGNVYGSVNLGPTASESISANGLITGGVFQDFNVEFEDVILPGGAWVPPSATNMTINGVDYTYVFDPLLGPNRGGEYALNNLNGRIYVGSNTVVTLKLTGDAKPGAIRVAGTNEFAGKLTIYMDGPSFSVSGATAVDGGNALNLAYYGTTNNTQVSFNGNASFTGTIYAPQANFSLGGGGSGNYDFVGATVTRSVKMNGHYKFHFDENLIMNGPMIPFVAASWREIPYQPDQPGS